MSIDLTPEERPEIFGSDDPAQYDDEVREYWGDTDAYAESQRRTSTYTKDDWLRIKAAGDAIEAELGEILRSGAAPDSVGAMDLAERYRQHLSASFYDLPHALQRTMADRYVSDERFRSHFDHRTDGLAAYLRDAIHANAERHGA